MADLDRMVGGLRCRDVLGLLADYVDGNLKPDLLGRVNAHLVGCDTCEKFGGEYAALVARLREGHPIPTGDAALRARLDERMTSLWTAEEG